MSDTYDFDVNNFDVDPLHDNCIVKMQYKTTEYKTPGGIRIPETWVEKSPWKPFFGVILDYGDIQLGRYEEDDELEKAKYTKYGFDQAVKPLKHVGAFSRARYLPLDHDGEKFAFVKMQNVLWVEPYKDDVFIDKDDKEVVQQSDPEFQNLDNITVERGDDSDKQYVQV